MSKSKAYLKRVAQVARVADARTELSPAALQALAKTPDRMTAAVFNELTSKGYLVCERRSWRFSAKAEAYRCAASKFDPKA